MVREPSSRALAYAFVLALATAAPAATIQVVDQDGPGEGFNDPTPVAPVGGNAATTLGAQRLAAFQYAADVWGSILASSVPVQIDATMDPLACTKTTATLGQAAPTTVARDFPGAPLAGHWYALALARKLAGMAIEAGTSDVTAQFSSAVGTTCPIATWYYGLDGAAPPNTIDFVTVVLHELGHGLGFETFVDETTGRELLGLPDAFEAHLETDGAAWTAMTDAQRLAAATATGHVRWKGAAVAAASGVLTSGADAEGRVLMYAPPTVVPGSSISHWDSSLAPPELLQPSYTEPIHDPSLAVAALVDMGWDTGPASSATTTTVAGPTTTTTTTTPPTPCPAVPAPGCRPATSSVVRVAARRLRWTWRGGDTVLGDFADPTTPRADVRLCVYDASSTAQPLLDATIPTGTVCGRRSCWTARATRYAFHDAAGRPDGVVAAIFHAGGGGSGRIAVTGRGTSLTGSAAPAAPLRVQLRVVDGAQTQCWESAFGRVRPARQGFVARTH